MLFYFYKTTNLINNKIYYGVHSSNNINDGYLGSGVILNKAIKKYGKKNFKFEIIKFFDSINDAFKYEQQIVNEEFIKNENNYNIIPGGRGLQGGTNYTKQFAAKGIKTQKEKCLAFFNPSIRQMGTETCRTKKLGLFNSSKKQQIIKKSHSKEAEQKRRKTMILKHNNYYNENNPKFRHDINQQEVIDLRNSGMTFRDLAKHFNCSTHAIQNRLKFK